MSRGVRAVILMLALILVVGACSGSDSGDTGGGGGTGGDQAKPKPGGKVTIAMEAETTGGYCLSNAQLAAGGIQVARAIYDTLTIPNENNEMVGFLAQSVEPNDKFTVWTIKIRPGITFHNGEALNAKVVKDNLDHYTGEKDPKNALFKFELDATRWIDSIEATDDMTVVVTLKQPWVTFNQHLYSYGRMGMMAEEQMNSGDKCARNMIGTGPFKFDGDWVTNDHLTVNKNPSYWRKDADGNALPYLDSVTFKPVPDPSRMTNAIQAKEFDLALTGSADVINGLTPAKDAGTLNFLQETGHPEVTYQIFNVTAPPFDNINARKAVAWAINSEEYNELRQFGLQTKTYGPFGESVLGYLPLDAYPADSFPPPTGDTEKAKEFAAAYKSDTGKDLEFTYLTAQDTSSLDSAKLIQDYLKDAGIKMDIKQEEQSKTISDVIGAQYQTAAWRNHPGFDPDNQWVWWHCYSDPAPGDPATQTNIGVGEGVGNNCDNLVNFTHFNDATINKALETGRSSNDPAVRKKAYEDLNLEFAKQVWSGWAYYTIWTIPSQTNVQGIAGPNLPTADSVNAVGDKPYPGLSSWVDIAGLNLK